MEPTDEQEDAIGLFLAGIDMAIEAGAGTGKTSTLTMVAQEAGYRRSGQYCVFNRAAVNDAVRRMPAWVSCSTINSVAARANRSLLHRLEARRQPSWLVAKHLGIHQGVLFRSGDRARTLSSSYLAGHTMRALTAFCLSDDPAPSEVHFPVVAALDPWDDPLLTNNRELAAMLLPYLNTAWADMQKENGVLRFTHDAYVKMWALGGPQLPVDYVLVDEAQDLSPVHIGVFAAQEAQVVWVGDTCQQIYEWRGARNALATVEATCRTYLTRSFRFGQPIADAANQVLALLPTELRLTGDPNRTSTVQPVDQPRAVLTRTNAVGVERVLRYQKQGVAVHLVGGGTEVIQFARAAERLKEEGRCDHPEIGCFDSWRSVQHYVAEDPLGAELKLLVDLVDTFGTEAIIEALDDMCAEPRADVIVSTAHKAKGREWGSVQLASDFPEYADSMDEDWRLFYVALTRARNALDPYRTEAWRSLQGQQEVPT